MSNVGKDLVTERIPPHRVLREVLRHYTEYRDLISANGGDGVINHGYYVYDGDTGEIDEKVEISLSFWDLIDCLKPQSEGGILSDRKREAIFYNVILDMKQKEVAHIMKITTVSVGQYVEQGMIQLAKKLFAEQYEPVAA